MPPTGTTGQIELGDRAACQAIRDQTTLTSSGQDGAVAQQEVLARQHDIAWKLLELHLADLTDDEMLRRPAHVGMHVHLVGNVWHADWPDREDYGAGPSSVAWLTWHIGFWWSMVLDHSFGPATLRREDVTWPGSADATRNWLSELHGSWVEAVGALPEAEFASTDRARWPIRDRPFADVAAWVNLELMKNAAEIGYARFLYAVDGQS